MNYRPSPKKWGPSCFGNPLSGMAEHSAKKKSGTKMGASSHTNTTPGLSNSFPIYF
jgi:hypothetical protein